MALVARTAFDTQAAPDEEMVSDDGKVRYELHGKRIKSSTTADSMLICERTLGMYARVMLFPSTGSNVVVYDRHRGVTRELTEHMDPLELYTMSYLPRLVVYSKWDGAIYGVLGPKSVYIFKPNTTGSQLVPADRSISVLAVVSNKHVVTGHDDGSLTMHNTDGMSRNTRMSAIRPFGITCISICAVGRYMVVGDAGGGVVVRDPNDGIEIARMVTDRPVKNITVSGDDIFAKTDAGGGMLVSQRIYNAVSVGLFDLIGDQDDIEHSQFCQLYEDGLITTRTTSPGALVQITAETEIVTHGWTMSPAAAPTVKITNGPHTSQSLPRVIIRNSEPRWEVVFAEQARINFDPLAVRLASTHTWPAFVDFVDEWTAKIAEVIARKQQEAIRMRARAAPPRQRDK